MTDAPRAARRPQRLLAHGIERIDDYYWLRDDERTDADVLAYLNAENDYTAAVLGHTEELQQQIFDEMRSRMKDDDQSVPVLLDGYYYYRRFEKGAEQPIHARRKGAEDAPEQILLDENSRGRDVAYYRVGSYAVCPNDHWLAWTEDPVSRNEFTLRLKPVHADRDETLRIERVSPSIAWSSDGTMLFYIKLQEGTLIPYQVWAHRIGTAPDADELLYEEQDPAFYMTLGPSRDRAQLLVHLHSTLTSEVLMMPLANPAAGLKPVIPREPGHEYDVEPFGDQLFIRSNRDAPNFRIWRVLPGQSDAAQWVELVPHQADVLIEDFAVYEGHVVTEETADANRRLNIVPLDGQDARLIVADDPAFSMGIVYTPDSRSTILRYAYSSLTTPTTIYDLDLASGERRQRKREFAGPDFDGTRYRIDRQTIQARDGESVPVTLFERADADRTAPRPTYLLGYGAYGMWYDPAFRRDVLSLVDRGFVFAIAHIRGGQELGRRWYDAGRLQQKTNTFTDFIDVADGLVERGIADRQRLVGYGRSAGGLLIGAVANMAPESFAILATDVPFVDVVTTMLDESIPLTTFEYDEWGNPNEREFFDVMLAYSPYDQVAAQDYPHMYVGTGLWDSQVQYWEPAKWVARLRETKTDANRLLLYTDMQAGHGGGSGRYERLRDTAREYAFILDTLKMTETKP